MPARAIRSRLIGRTSLPLEVGWSGPYRRPGSFQEQGLDLTACTTQSQGCPAAPGCYRRRPCRLQPPAIQVLRMLQDDRGAAVTPLHRRQASVRIRPHRCAMPDRRAYRAPFRPSLRRMRATFSATADGLLGLPFVPAQPGQAAGEGVNDGYQVLDQLRLRRQWAGWPRGSRNRGCRQSTRTSQTQIGSDGPGGPLAAIRSHALRFVPSVPGIRAV